MVRTFYPSALLFRRRIQSVLAIGEGGRRDANAPGQTYALLRAALVLGALVLATLLLSGCRERTEEMAQATPPPVDVPAPVALDHSALAAVTSAFAVGVTALQVGDTDTAVRSLRDAAELAPWEPAILADLAIALQRGNDASAADEALATAITLAPESAAVALVEAGLRTRQGDAEAARAALERAVDVAPDDLRARFALARMLEDAGESDAAGSLLEQVGAAAPENLAVAVARLRHAARAGDMAALGQILEVIDARGAAVPEAARAQLVVARDALADDASAAGPQAAVGLANLLLAAPAYRSDQALVQSNLDDVAEPIPYFLTLEMPAIHAAIADVGLSFAAEEVFAGQESASMASPARLFALPVGDGSSMAVAARDQDGNVTLVDGDGVRELPTGEWVSVRPLDFDNDGTLETLVAGDGALGIVDASGALIEDFAEVAANISLGDVSDVWPLDIDLDGDLDLIVARGDDLPPVVLQNDGDGGWSALESSPWPDLVGLRAMVTLDADGDGDGDVFVIDGRGTLLRYDNQRSGFYSPGALPADLSTGRFAALAVGDTNLDARLELVALRVDDGSVIALDFTGDGAALIGAADDGNGGTTAHGWRVVANVPEGTALEDSTATLFVADLDLNGAQDVVVGTDDGSFIWLGGIDGMLEPLETVVIGGRVDAVADVVGNGRLDLVGVDGVGRLEAVATVWRNEGGQHNYAHQILRLQGHTLGDGDQRNNYFGVGGEVVVRAGLLVQARPVLGPMVHFGIGDAAVVEVIRVRWPNGSLQAEFDLETEQTVAIDQRLTGSCPWLFAWNGTEMAFATDILWRSPLGLRINAQDTAGVVMTYDRVRLGPEQIAPREGYYDLRVTAELWETHFFDYMSLVTVDHPADVAIWVDERFSIPPPSLEPVVTTHPQPLDRVVDATGMDVTAAVAALDGVYADGFALGRYQGIAGDHWLEMTLPNAEVADSANGAAIEGHANTAGGEVLIARGWVYPTDSSINVAISQGDHVPPVPLSLEVPDGAGGWRVERDGLGFPAGKNKTMVIDLDGLWLPGEPRRLRLRTTMEIYWDYLGTATRRTDIALQPRTIAAAEATLRYRGFSTTNYWPHGANSFRRMPELPDYDRLASTAPQWFDLSGLYTRFGDVRELLAAVDDRYAILNAGDELVLRFAAPPEPGSGMVRTVFLDSDGWVKDGNFNTAYSDTVHPLPSHDRPEYADQLQHGPAGELVDDPVYRRHVDDWVSYHTRHVLPSSMSDALRVGPAPDAASGIR